MHEKNSFYYNTSNALVSVLQNQETISSHAFFEKKQKNKSCNHMHSQTTIIVPGRVPKRYDGCCTCCCSYMVLLPVFEKCLRLC